MSVAVIGGSNFVGRYLLRQLAGQKKALILGDMYPFRQSVYRLQEELNLDLVKHSLFYPTGLKYSIGSAEEVIIVTHDYFQLAHSKNFLLEKTAMFAKKFGVKKLTWVAPMELDQLNKLDGDPDALLSESEKKAKDFFPELAVLKVNLLFGKYCNSLLIRNAIESLENEQAVLDYNDMSSKFEPVYEEDFFKALKELKPGERVVLGGPEKLSWRKIVEQLAAGLGKQAKFANSGSSASLVLNDTFGDMLYPSQTRQLYKVLEKGQFEQSTKQGSKKLEQFFTKGVEYKNDKSEWHKVVVD